MRLKVYLFIGVGTGWQWGHLPPQPEPCQDAVLGLTMIHSMNIDSPEYTLLNLQLISSLLQPRKSGLPIPGPNFSLADAKMGVVFTKCGHGPKILHTMRTINILCPHNVQHLPMPLSASCKHTPNK